ncbi:hypothetical protein H4R19_003368 [Coemansia spiralis]|nr:hypothetical protein H4R19_003368 [Coemansia spiralis]
MPLCDLPDDILIIVLGEAARCPISCSTSFSNAAPLLAVSRRWRCLALPIAYPVAYFDYNSECATSSGQSDRSATINLDSPRIKTNLDLIAAAGCANLVKEVHIDVKNVKAPLDGLAVAVEQLGKVTTHWSRVDTLRVLSGRVERDDLNDTVAIQPLASALLGMCPGVRSLWASSNVISSTFDDTYALLAAGYVSQLRELRGRPVALPAGVVFNRLEWLTLMLLEGNEPLPQSVDTGRLRHLELNSLPLSFSWDMFASNGNQGIVFPELVSLTIEYEWLASGNPQRLPRLYFPKLRMARVCCHTDDIPLLRQAAFPAQMDKLQIEAPAALFLTLDDVEIPQVKHIQITLVGRAVGPDALVAVNRFLSRARGFQKNSLTIKTMLADVRPETITCASLTILEVHGQVSADVVLALIEHLQHLQTLECYNVTTRRMLADVSVAPLDAHEPMEPLSTSLQSLGIAPTRNCSDYDMVALVQYLLVRLPNMKRLSVARASKQSVLDFAHDYASLYPHLANASDVVVARE